MKAAGHPRRARALITQRRKPEIRVIVDDISTVSTNSGVHSTKEESCLLKDRSGRSMKLLLKSIYYRG
jgi:hypothetical protein